MKKLILVLLLLKSSSVFSQIRYDKTISPLAIYIEDFSSNYKNWPEVDNETVGLKIINEEYHTQAAKNNIILPREVNYSLSNKKNLWRLSTEVTYVDGYSYFGILFGSLDSKVTYAYMIDGGGNYIIVEINESGTKVFKQDKSSKINIGKGAKNILSIETDNDYYHNTSPSISFFVNGSRVTELTLAEQAAIKAKEDAEKKDDFSVTKFSAKEFEDMQKHIELHSIDPENTGNGKIGIIATTGVAANFDNIILEIKKNDGRIIMYNNKWGYNPALSKYLDKNIAADEETERVEIANTKIKSDEEALAHSKNSISRLSDELLHPYGNTVAAAKPDPIAVNWLNKIIFQMNGTIGGLLYSYPEKELIEKNDTLEKYNIRHYLPGITFKSEIEVDTKTQKANCYIPIAQGLTREEAIVISSNYLANVAAAFNNYGNSYYEPQNRIESKEIPRTLLINGSSSILNDNYVAALLDVKKDKEGKYFIVLTLIGK